MEGRIMSAQTAHDDSEIPEVTLVFEDDTPPGPAPGEPGRDRVPRFSQRGRQQRPPSRTQTTGTDRSGGGVERGHLLPQGRLTPAVLGITLGVTALVGILVVNMASAGGIAVITTPSVVVASVALATLAGLATTVFGPLMSVLVTFAVAAVLGGVEGGRERRGLRSAWSHPRAIAFLFVMVTAWMLKGLVASVTASGAAPFVVQAAAFTAALATAVTVTAPAPRRAVTAMVSGALALAVSVLLVLAGGSTVVASAGSAVVGVATVLLGAAAWNRWFAPVMAARDLFRGARPAA